MKKVILSTKKFLNVILLSLTVSLSYAQTNVYDDIIATSPQHTSLDAAIQQAGLVSALQDPNATFTVFAPDNNAFDDLANELGTTVSGLLALPNLGDILLYHVLGTTNTASTLSNGQIVTPLNAANTVKLTVTSNSEVYANQAMVNGADLTADNGVVHSVDAVILPGETVADIAIDNGFTTLVTAVATAELLPALTDPFATFTVFAPDNAAFDNAAMALGVTTNDLLALPNLQDILLYHVLDVEVDAASVSDGGIVDAISTTNTIKTTVTESGEVFINQAEVQLADLIADNGLVHTIDQVLLPSETVVDVALDNGFTTLTAAVIEAELLPALVDPFAEFTVFAPTNQAFDNLASDLGVTVNDILALPNLGDILLYHCLGSEVLSTALSNGQVTTLNGSDVLITVATPPLVNDAEVSMADIQVDNGVVHVINKVLDPAVASVDESAIDINIFPNPSTDVVNITTNEIAESIQILSADGTILKSIVPSGSQSNINISDLATGQYFVVINTANGPFSKSIQVKSTF